MSRLAIPANRWADRTERRQRRTDLRSPETMVAHDRSKKDLHARRTARAKNLCEKMISFARARCSALRATFQPCGRGALRLELASRQNSKSRARSRAISVLATFASTRAIQQIGQQGALASARFDAKPPRRSARAAHSQRRRPRSSIAAVLRASARTSAARPKPGPLSAPTLSTRRAQARVWCGAGRRQRIGALFE